MHGISVKKAPSKGLILAYFEEQLVFAKYEKLKDEIVFDGCDALTGETPWECHLFDGETEYRMVTREAHGDRIECCFSAQEEREMDPDLIYTEEVCVKEEYCAKDGIPKKLVIVSRYRYTENDTLELKNYRIAVPAAYYL